MLMHAAHVPAQEMGNEVSWLLPAEAPMPRLIKEPRLFGGNMPAGDSERELIDLVRAGRVKEVKETLALGTRANAQDIEGRRPLHEAVVAGHQEITRLLLRAGADPNAGNAYGRSALDMAILHGRDRIVPMLLEYGADLELRNGIGNTPLVSALLLQRDDMARLFMQRGARLDARSGDKRCVAELAATHAGEALLQEILQQGGAEVCQ